MFPCASRNALPTKLSCVFTEIGKPHVVVSVKDIGSVPLNWSGPAARAAVTGTSARRKAPRATAAEPLSRIRLQTTFIVIAPFRLFSRRLLALPWRCGGHAIVFLPRAGPERARPAFVFARQ